VVKGHVPHPVQKRVQLWFDFRQATLEFTQLRFGLCHEIAQQPLHKRQQPVIRRRIVLRLGGLRKA